LKSIMFWSSLLVIVGFTVGVGFSTLYSYSKSPTNTGGDIPLLVLSIIGFTAGGLGLIILNIILILERNTPDPSPIRQAPSESDPEVVEFFKLEHVAPLVTTDTRRLVSSEIGRR